MAESTQVGSSTAQLSGAWAAIASTTNTEAVENIGADAVPIYLPDGVTVIASDTLSLFAAPIENPIKQDQFGHVASRTVWTGMHADGTTSSFALGDSAATVGSSAQSDSRWADSGVLLTDFSASVYAISSVQVAHAAVPESKMLYLIFLLVAVLFQWRI